MSVGLAGTRGHARAAARDLPRVRSLDRTSGDALGETPLMMRVATGTIGHNEPDEIARFARMTQMPGTGRAFQRTVGGVINPLGQYMQTWQRIGDVESLPPVATFRGEKDPILPLRHGLSARHRIEVASLSIYPQCGHYPHLDSSVRFARELAEFLSNPLRPVARLLQ